jgi:hypothetical protein
MTLQSILRDQLVGTSHVRVFAATPRNLTRQITATSREYRCMSIRKLVVTLSLALATFCIVSSLTAKAWATPPPTPMRSYVPVAGAELKKAAACYDSRDMYVVAAVFTIPYFTTTYDAVYQLRIQGNSAAANYGELIGATFVRSEWQINDIDCASSGGGNIFVAFDRTAGGAIWYRWDNTAINGPFTMSTCEGLLAARPRVAYGGGRVMIAYEGDNHTGAAGSVSCGVCSQQFSQAGASIVENIEFWRESVHWDYDAEWNGSQFMMAVQWQADGWDPETFALTTLRYNSIGNEVAENLVHFYEPDASPAPGTRLKLTYSQNSRNTANAMFLQTNNASYWLNTSGAAVGSEIYYGAGMEFAACEYWGADNAAATIFTPSMYWTWEGGFPGGYFVLHHRTARAHFGLTSAAPYETSTLNDGWVPRACEASSSYTDGEVILVSERASSDPALYWNLVPSD